MNFLELDKKDGSPRALINPDHVTHIEEYRYSPGSIGEDDITHIWIHLVSGKIITSDATYEKVKEAWELAMRDR